MSFDDHAVGVGEFQMSLIDEGVSLNAERHSAPSEHWAITHLEEGAFQTPTSISVLPDELLEDGEEVSLSGFEAELFNAIARFYEEGALGSLFIFVREEGHLLSSEINPDDIDPLELPEGLEMVLIDGGNSITGESYKVTFFIDQQQVVKVFD